MAYNADEEIRRLKHISAKKPIIKRGLPDTSEGRDGDVALCLNRAGLGLYIKFNRKWYKFADGKQVATGGSAAVDLSNRTSTRIPKLIVDELEVKDLAHIVGTLKGGSKGTVNDKIIRVVEDTQLYVDEKQAFHFDMGNASVNLGTAIDLFSMGSTTTNTHSYFNISTVTANYDSALRFLRGGSYKWIIGNDGSDSDKFCIHSSSATIANTSDVEIASGGAIVSQGTLTSSNGVCSGTGALDTGSSNITTTGTISGGTINGSVIWQEWVFNVFRGVADRYYYRDIDDADDFRRWDAYSTLSGSNISIVTQMVAGHFVIPEDCTIKSMYGQIMNNGGTSQATITIWHGDPSDATDVTLTSLGGAQPNPGGSIVSQKSYIFSKTDYNTNLSAGDIIVPTIHYGAGSLQSFVGGLTVKFVTR